KALFDECLASALFLWPSLGSGEHPPRDLLAQRVEQILALTRDLATTTFPDAESLGDQPATAEQLAARVAACRAVRGCVLKRWSASQEGADRSDFDEVVRFTEAIDEW